MSETDNSKPIDETLGRLKSVGEAGGAISDQAVQAGTDALTQAKEVAADAKSRAGSVAGVLSDRAAEIGEAQKTQLADTLEDVAKAVHRSGEQLEGHQDVMAHLVERGAAELGSLAKTLRSNDLQSLIGELGDLARRQPALFVGASMAAGFALTRVGRVAVKAPAPSPAPPAPSVGGAETPPPESSAVDVATRAQS